MNLISICVKRYKNIGGILLILLSNTTTVIANALLGRKFLNEIWYELSVGGGIDFYKTNTSPEMKLTDKDGEFFIKGDQNQFNTLCIAQWPSEPLIERYLSNNEKPIFTYTGHSYKGVGTHVPIFLLVMINFAKLRLGIGTGMNFNFLLKELTYQKNKNSSTQRDQDHHDNTKRINFSIKSKKMYKTFYPTIMLGYVLKECKGHTFLSDFHWAPVLYISKLANRYHLFIRFSNFQISVITWEKHLSPYCRLATKLRYHVEREIIDAPTKIIHWKNSIALHFGMSLRIPDFPSCPYEQCRVKIDHKHNGKAYSRFHIR